MTKLKIRTAFDFLKVEGFIEVIDPKFQPLKKIVVHYHLDAEHPCGLRSCRQPHKDGFLVELDHGGFSNVGNVCGQQFGDKFALEKTRYAEQVQRPEAIRILKDTLAKIEANRPKIIEIEAQADRLSRCAQSLKAKFPSLGKDIVRRAHSGDDRVTEEIPRSEREIDDMHALNPGGSREQHRYRSEFRGVLPGVRVLARNLRQEVIVSFVTPSEALRQLDLGSTTTSKLIELETWATTFDDRLKNAKELVDNGLSLFSPESFKLMALVARAPNERSLIAKMNMEALLKADTSSVAADHGKEQARIKSKKEIAAERRVKALQEQGRGR